MPRRVAHNVPHVPVRPAGPPGEALGSARPRALAPALAPALALALALAVLAGGLAGGCGASGGQDPETMSVEAVQALFDRDFDWLAENGAPEWENFLEEDQKADEVEDLADGPTFRDKIAGEFEYETAVSSWDDPPPRGADVEVVEGSYTASEDDEDVYRAGFDYVLDGGEAGGAADVILLRGPDGGWRVAGIELEYPEDQSLSLGPTT